MVMKQKLKKSVVSYARGSRRKIENDKKNFENTFINTKCPYCSSDHAYFYGLKFDTAGYCPNCNVNWIEVGNDAIWKLPR